MFRMRALLLAAPAASGVRYWPRPRPRNRRNQAPTTAMPLSRAPVVAVTATTEVVRGIARVRLNEAYMDALLGAGLVPLVVAPTEQSGVAERVLDVVEGL